MSEPEADPFDGLLDDDADAPLLPKRKPSSTARRFSLPMLVGVAALAAAVGFGIGMLGRPATSPTALPSGHPSIPVATAQPTATIDQAKVDALKERINTDPTDHAAMAELGDLYSLAGDATNARLWHTKALSLNPENTDVMLALGVDLFNLGAFGEAIRMWEQVTTLNPGEVEAWYNLGWAHIQADPPDAAKADAAWAKVVELAPDSEMAKAVRNHQPDQMIPSPTPGK